MEMLTTTLVILNRDDDDDNDDDDDRDVGDIINFTHCIECTPISISSIYLFISFINQSIYLPINSIYLYLIYLPIYLIYLHIHPSQRSQRDSRWYTTYKN